MNIKKHRMGDGLNCLAWILFIGGLLWALIWTFKFQERQGIYKLSNYQLTQEHCFLEFIWLQAKVTDASDGCWVLDTCAHLLSHAFLSQSASESLCIKQEVT
jgi:hypothetical protein